jgi:signal transduction histidine kinase
MKGSTAATPEETVSELTHVSQRAETLFKQHMAGLARRVDRMLAVVLGVETIAAIAFVALVSPAAGRSAIWAGAFCFVAVLAAAYRPGRATNRYLIAFAMAPMLSFAGGPFEAHFQVFATLAFLSLYRDWRVLVVATAVALVGASREYGNPASWHAPPEYPAWILFEAVVLVVACVEGVSELRAMAEKSAEIDWQCRLFSEIDRKKSQDLAQALKELEESQEARARTDKLAAVGQLAASVGHELRNPLAAVRNAATYVKRRLTDPKFANQPVAGDPKIAQFLDLMFRELDVSAKIIADLLDFARERKPALSPCPLRQLVDEAIEVIPKSSVHIANQVPEDLPIPNIDKDQFRQIVVNLVQNAMEAAAGARDGQVSIRAEGGAGDAPWQLQVIDNGIGMPKEVLEKIFQPLYTTKVKGTGLGLAVVSNMVKAHNGTIKAESEEGRGSRFTIVLPRQPPKVRESVASFPGL